MIIYTGNYNNCKSGNLISISGNRGRDAGFEGKYCEELAPKYRFWKEWHDSLDIMTKEESTKFYTEHYYYEVLKKINPKKVLELLGKDPILLCYENPEEFCHRHLAARYFETLGYFTSEIKIDEKGNIEYLNRPKYIGEMLDKVMNSDPEYKEFKELKRKQMHLVMQADKNGYNFNDIELSMLTIIGNADTIKDISSSLKIYFEKSYQIILKKIGR